MITFFLLCVALSSALGRAADPTTKPMGDAPDLLTQLAPTLSAWIDEGTARMDAAADALAEDVRIMVYELLGKLEEDEGISGTMRGGEDCGASATGLELPRPGMVRTGGVGDAVVVGAVRTAWLEDRSRCDGRRCARMRLEVGDVDAEGYTSLPIPTLPAGDWVIDLRRTGWSRACAPFKVRVPEAPEEAQILVLPIAARIVWLGGEGRLWDVQSLGRQLQPEQLEERRLVALVACAWGMEPEILGAGGESCAIWHKR